MTYGAILGNETVIINKRSFEQTPHLKYQYILIRPQIFIWLKNTDYCKLEEWLDLEMKKSDHPEHLSDHVEHHSNHLELLKNHIEIPWNPSIAFLCCVVDFCTGKPPFTFT